MPNEKETQVRTCIVTGAKHQKADMLRLVSFRSEAIKIDVTGKLPGRGCYVSVESENLEKLLNKNASVLARVFKRQITKEEIKYLEEEFPKAIEAKRFRNRHSKSVKVRISKEDFKKIVSK